MAGVNTFIDHDLSRSHTRIGVGAEYWRDYLKLSANGYIRASGWKKSPDIEDYQERPANGWDIRAEGYLPACIMAMKSGCLVKISARKTRMLFLPR